MTPIVTSTGVRTGVTVSDTLPSRLSVRTPTTVVTATNPVRVTRWHTAAYDSGGRA